jgi:hypothetical protein
MSYTHAVDKTAFYKRWMSLNTSPGFIENKNPYEGSLSIDRSF